MSSTDVRLIPCMHSFANQWPIPDCYHQSLKYYPLDKGQLQMQKLSIVNFVVLLATVLVVGKTDRIPSHHTLNLIHELYLQAKTLEWSKFGSNKYLKSLTKTECLNACTGIAIKVCQLLYRKKKSERLQLACDVNLSSRALLREIEVFARDQMKYSKSGNGEFNMAWIATQSSAVLNVDPLSAAADALHWYTKAYTAADKYGDDFVSGSARIEAAGCLFHCGGGVLEIPTPVHGRAVVRRDFRTEFGEKTKEGQEKSGIPMLDVFDMEHAKFTTSYETERLLSGKSITTLTSGERHIVEWKISLSLWNQAMKYYDCMVDIGVGYFMFGDSTYWMEVIFQIRKAVENCNTRKLALDDCDYKTPLFTPGIRD
ncbi:predicted protein [Chaetoceros tenuissimus]|uniref:Uncharacterized protein n=1 Tax=Chaetoceros tenuissimus TaxID=426638 RepID=A0AAD3H1R7_9STRA|nr:predicted protein [Chaetoceros tenuissimus]